MSAVSRKRQPIATGQLLITTLLGLLILLTPACSQDNNPTSVDLSRLVPNKALETRDDNHLFHIGIGPRVTPREGYTYYQQLIRYLDQNMGLAIQVVGRGTYDEINTLLEHHQLDAAFVSGGAYVDGRERFGLELLVKPEMENGTVYNAYLIVPADSPAHSLEDLRGKTFAFTDPHSNAGLIVPTYWLATMGETPDSFFAKHIFTYAHDSSIKAVVDKLVDGAAVDSLTWDFMNSSNPEIGVKTRIISRSQEFGTPPLVVRKDLPAEQKNLLRDLLLNLHLDPVGRDILAAMRIRRFVSGHDSDYDKIRQMRDFIERSSGGNK